MNGLRSRSVTVVLRAYVIGCLVAAAVVSSPMLSFIPVLLLGWYLFLWRWPVNAVVCLCTTYFLFFTIAVLLAQAVGPFFSLLVALPVLVLVTADLEETSRVVVYWNTSHGRGPTRLGMALALVAAVALVVAALVGALSLLVAGGAVLVYLVALGVEAARGLPGKPVEETPVRLRMVAGADERLNAELRNMSRSGGLLTLESPYDWLRVSPLILSLRQKGLIVRTSLSPPLSGPSVVKLKGRAVDRWGLVQTGFELELLNLYVIPRARYAAWLARKYLEEMRAGAMPLVSDTSGLKPAYGLRRGVEYYGSQLYQPGDSLRSIDWKHSYKYGELISKEFFEIHGQSAILLVNLAVGSSEEADVLAYKLIMTAVSLARENIPARLAAYDQDAVRLTTGDLQPRRLISECVRVGEGMVTIVGSERYLSSPDVTRLRVDIGRVRHARGRAPEVLARLLESEYRNLSSIARRSPATAALTQALTRGDRQSSLVLISQRNHDAAALAFAADSFARKGHAVIAV